VATKLFLTEFGKIFLILTVNFAIDHSKIDQETTLAITATLFPKE